MKKEFGRVPEGQTGNAFAGIFGDVAPEAFAAKVRAIDTVSPEIHTNTKTDITKLPLLNTREINKKQIKENLNDLLINFKLTDRLTKKENLNFYNKNIINSLLGDDRLNVIEGQFPEPPVEAAHERMAGLRSFALLGLDLKITPDGQVKVIEVNGLHAGVKGYARALGTEGNELDKAIQQHIGELGEESVGYLALQLDRALVVQGRFRSPRGSLFTPFIHPDWDSLLGDAATTLIGVEKILKDKYATDTHFTGIRAFKPPTIPYTEAVYTDLEQYGDLFALKPNSGARGNGVQIVTGSELQAILSSGSLPKHGYVIEPFVPSKPIMSTIDGQEHDGCMRYVVAVEESKSGDIEVHHFGGYWRLSPKPMTAGLDIDAMRANLSQGALPERLSVEDIEITRAAVDAFVPAFYASLLSAVRDITETTSSYLEPVHI